MRFCYQGSFQLFNFQFTGRQHDSNNFFPIIQWKSAFAYRFLYLLAVLLTLTGCQVSQLQKGNDKKKNTYQQIFYDAMFAAYLAQGMVRTMCSIRGSCFLYIMLASCTPCTVCRSILYRDVSMYPSPCQNIKSKCSVVARCSSLLLL